MWDLLGDVGGFNDGLVLVSSLLFGFYGSFAFRKDLVSITHVDHDLSGKHNSKSIAFQSSQDYQRTVNMLKDKSGQSESKIDS